MAGLQKIICLILVLSFDKGLAQKKTTQPAKCFSDNFNWVGLDFPAENIGIPKITSPENCQALCQLIPDCKYFSYSMKSQKCYFKQLGYNLQPKSSYISGPKNCPSTPAHKVVKIVTTTPTTTTSTTTTTKPRITGDLVAKTIDGVLKQISSNKRVLWGINTSNNLYTTTLDSKEGVSWKQIPGQYLWVSIGPNEVWATNKDTTIESCKKPCDGKWLRIQGNLNQISVGALEVWGVNSNDDIFVSGLPFNGWINIGGKLRNISNGKIYVYGVNAAGNVFRCKHPCRGIWETLPGILAQISASLEDESVFGVNKANELFSWTGSDWVRIGAAQLSNVDTVNKNEIFGCTVAGNIVYGQ